MEPSAYEILFSRQHPQLAKNLHVWERSRAAYAGGGGYIKRALVKHVSENDLEYAERLARGYYFNYPRKVATMITRHVLARTPTRDGADPDIVEDFSRSGLRANEVMRQFCTMLNTYGMAWMMVDMPGFQAPLTMQAKAEGRIRPYAYALPPLDVPDWAYGLDGKLLWAIVKERGVECSDPLAKPMFKDYRRLWTRDSWMLLSKSDNGKLKVESEGKHKLGQVPLIRVEECDGFGMDASHWFEDVVRVSDAILNHESEAQMNAVKQMFGLLVVSEGFYFGGGKESSTGGEADSFAHTLSRSAAIYEGEQEKGTTRYIAPNGVETATLRSEIQNLKKELFDIVGLAVQKESKTEQTAESKAWDNQNVEQYLAARADTLEQVENQVWQLMNAWDKTVTAPQVKYNRIFSVVDLQAAVGSLLELSSLDTGEEFKREVARAALTVLARIKEVPQDVAEKIAKEIEALDLTPEAALPAVDNSAFGKPQNNQNMEGLGK